MSDYSPFSAEQQRDHAIEARNRVPEPDPRIDLNAHLADIIVDVGRVRKVLNDDEHSPCIPADSIKDKLSDVSNLLDDLYNEIRGI